jgi:CRP/FNR family transcriptional regulator, cyclic AMP receptor protein
VVELGIPREDVDFLSLLSDVNRRRLLEGSARIVYPAGAIAFHPEAPPLMALLDRGMVRAYCAIPDGRQATVSFIHARELIGGTVLVSRPVWFVQAVIDSTLTMLDLPTVRNLWSKEAEVIAAIATQLTQRVRNAYRLIAVRSLGNIRERLAYDLLDRACRGQLASGRLEARVTHADLAASIGSSREVVSRALGGLRAEGIVETAPAVVRVIQPMRLAAIVRAFVI